MKKYICFIILVVGFQQVFSQAMDKGVKKAGLGVGFARTFASNMSNRPSLAPRVTFEQGMWDFGPGVVTLGGTVGASWQSFSSVGNYNGQSTPYTWRWANYILGARSAWYYNGGDFGLDFLNAYAGVTLGVAIVTFKENTYGQPPVGYSTPSAAVVVRPFFGTYLGANYYFSDQLAVFLEVGYEVSTLMGGINYRFF